MPPSRHYEIRDLVLCRNCYGLRPSRVSLPEWNRLEIGTTETGFQIWCARCLLNVANVTATIEEFCGEFSRKEDPSPNYRRIEVFGWRTCKNCGPTDRFGAGLFGQEICLVCGWETGIVDNEPAKE